MQGLLDRIGRGFGKGTIEFATARGSSWTIGSGDPHVRVRLRGRRTLLRILRNPALGFGETYVDGEWEPEDGDLRRVLGVAVGLSAHIEHHAHLQRLQRLAGYLREFNTPRSSQRHAAHHYNVDYELYRRFLDADLHYSCAYFRDPHMDLEQAQQAKCALIARKLDLRSGARVLDIGCGWGSLAMYLAEHHHARVTGITLSSAQLEVARRRARERGLDDRVEFRLEDYRDTRGRYDAVVSVGMFEHVGRPQYPAFFEHLAERLADDGTALLHTIGRLSPPSRCNPWIDKYIFPGGYIPAASELTAAAEATPLYLTDFEVWRQHYAHTLAEWHRRFEAARETLPAGLDARFVRMWRFYLLASEACFVAGDLVVFHAQFTRRLGRLPLTRDYLYR